MKKKNNRCPLQNDCERTCKHVGSEKDCDYYYNNCLPGMDIAGQEVNTDHYPAGELEEPTFTSECPYFIGMTDEDKDGTRQLLCSTRETPYTGSLYTCGCSPDADPGFDGCRLYWLKKLKDELGDLPPAIEKGNVANMRLFYDQECERLKLEDMTEEEAEAACLCEDTGTVPTVQVTSAPQKCAFAGAFVKDGLECLCDPERRAVMGKIKAGDHVQCLEKGPAPDCRAYYAGYIMKNEGIAIWKSMGHDSTEDLRNHVAQLKAAQQEQTDMISAGQDGDAVNCPPETTTPAAATDIAAMEHAPAALPTFDYTEVDETTGHRLGELQEAAIRARGTYAIAMARIIGEAHNLLCSTVVQQLDNGKFAGKEDTFRRWCASIGVTKSSAYNLLTVFQFLGSSTVEELEILKSQPATLLYSAARKDAPEQLVAAVKSGDITTNAEYQQLLKELEAEKEARRLADKKNEELFQTAHAFHVKADEAESQRNELLDKEGRQIAKAKELEKHLEGARQALEAAKFRGDKLKRENDELKSRPVDVAVAEPDPEDVEKLARQIADSMTTEIKGKLKTAEKNIESIRQQNQSLSDRLVDAQEYAAKQARELSEPLREQIRQLQEDLAASHTGSDTSDVNSLYDQVILSKRTIESVWGIAREALKKLPEDMRTAARKLLSEAANKILEGP